MFSKWRILFVGSDDENLDGLLGLLKCYASVKRIHTVQELRANLLQCEWDAVVSGWSVEKGSWKLAVDQVRQNSPGLPVIVCRSCGAEAEWHEALSYGALDLLVAPYTPNKVFPVLEQATESHHARVRISVNSIVAAKRRAS